MRGMEVCYHHGGKSLKGIASPNFKTGRRSKHMPKPLKQLFDESVADPELLDLTESIATHEAIIMDLLGSLDGADAPTRLVGKIRLEWRDFWQATAREDQAAVAKHREQIGTLLARAATVAGTIDRIIQVEEQKRKLVDTEDKRRERQRNYITAEQARFHYAALALAVKDALEKEVDDDNLRRRILIAISEGLIRVAGPAALPGPSTTH